MSLIWWSQKVGKFYFEHQKSGTVSWGWLTSMSLLCNKHTKLLVMCDGGGGEVEATRVSVVVLLLDSTSPLHSGALRKSMTTSHWWSTLTSTPPTPTEGLWPTHTLKCSIIRSRVVRSNACSRARNVTSFASWAKHLKAGSATRVDVVIVLLQLRHVARRYSEIVWLRSVAFSNGDSY